MALVGALALNAAMATETEETTTLDTTGGHTITVAAGDTLVYSGKITGSGQLTKIGGGVLKLTCPDNDFTGGISILTGQVEAARSGCLGTGSVLIRNNDVGLVFSAPEGVFSNAITKATVSGDFLDFKADTTLFGYINANSCTLYLSVDEGVKVVFKGDVNLGAKPFSFKKMKGTMVFDGKITSSGGGGIQMYGTTGSEGGKFIYNNPENGMGWLQFGQAVHVCSNENAIGGAIIKPRHTSTESGYVDLNGFDQRIRSLSFMQASNLSVIKSGDSTSARVVSETPATLTLTGTGAGTSDLCNCLVDGKVSLVIDADPAYTNQFGYRVNGMSGDVNVRSGVFDLMGENTRFPNVPKIIVGEQGGFISRSSYVGVSLPAVTNLTLASGGCFEIQNDTTKPPKHRCPFTQGRLHLDVQADSALRLMDDICVTVNTFRVSGAYQHKGSYTSAECTAIKSGTVVVLNGPPRGLCVSFK